MSTLVIDIGTSSVRAMVFEADATVVAQHRTPLPPATPEPGLVEFDPAEMAAAVLDLAGRACHDAGTVTSVGIATQRSSAVMWDANTGAPLGPGISWQDLRTARACHDHRANGLHFAPNQAATKFEYLLNTYRSQSSDVRLGTVDSWIAWSLSPGLHVTEPSNACVTGLWAAGWNVPIIEQLGIPMTSLPTIVDSIGPIGTAHALDGAPTVHAILGDQQASMLGQGCIEPGMTKCTFGTGAMLNICGTTTPPPSGELGEHGTFSLVAWTENGVTTWATEAIMLSAGSCLDWLRDSLGVVASVDELNQLAASCDDTGGVVFVPDLAGAGTPQWDFAAAGALVGVTRGTNRAHVCRAVLEGVAQRGADLLDAAIADAPDGRRSPDVLRIDGGMSQSAVFVQALANATGIPVQRSDHVEATALGAALAVARSTGHADEVAAPMPEHPVVEPAGPAHRDRWIDALSRSGQWFENR